MLRLGQDAHRHAVRWGLGTLVICSPSRSTMQPIKMRVGFSKHVGYSILWVFLSVHPLTPSVDAGMWEMTLCTSSRSSSRGT